MYMCIYAQHTHRTDLFSENSTIRTMDAHHKHGDQNYYLQYLYYFNKILEVKETHEIFPKNTFL